MDRKAALATVKTYLTDPDPIAAARAAFDQAYIEYEQAIESRKDIGAAHVRMMDAKSQQHLTEAAMNARAGIPQHGWNEAFAEIMRVEVTP